MRDRNGRLRPRQHAAQTLRLHNSYINESPIRQCLWDDGKLTCHMMYPQVHRVPYRHRLRALSYDKLGLNLEEVRLEIGGQSKQECSDHRCPFQQRGEHAHSRVIFRDDFICSPSQFVIIIKLFSR